MKKSLLIGSVVFLAGSLLAADSKDEVLAAAKKLAAKGNYSWKLTQDFGASSPFTPGPTEGKTADGLTWLSSSFQDNTMEGVMKNTNNLAVKTDEGWKSGSELLGDAGGGGGGFGNPGMFLARRLQGLKTPAAEIEDLVGHVKELKKDGDVYSGDLTTEGADSLLTMGFGGRRGGGQMPPATGVKGSLKVWIKDGMITKYETKASGKREFQGEEREMERNNTVEIKDVGATKISVPDEAKKKLS